MRNESEFKTRFRALLTKTCHVVAIENNIGRGMPDLNICHDGKEVWVELKVFSIGRVLIRPEQYAWGMKRSVEHGGTVYIAALHPNDRIHFWKFPDFFVGPYGKYLMINGLNTSCEINVDSIKTILFTC